MSKRTIALGLRHFNYDGLYLFAQGIHDKMQNMTALFPSPLPSLGVLQSSINKMSQAIEKWGKRGSLGGQPQKLALLEAREVLRNYLKSYAQYVMTTQPDDIQSWVDGGFVLKKLPAKTGSMQAVQDFHQFIARNIPQGQVKLRWKRPLSAPKATVITYKIFRSTETVFSNAILVGTVMNKATYTDIPPKAGVLFYYWVVPVTTAGDGVLSEMCSAFASPI